MSRSNNDRFRYDNRVVVVTGAGGGIGRAHAQAFAQQGASVVVNDLGVDVAGEGSGDSRSAADEVVATIINQGGEAVANYSPVESGDEIVKQVLDSYGRIDVLVNNAGIVFPAPFSEMTYAQWRKLLDTHLDGTFVCTRAAWPHMQANNYGRIIMTASPVLYGADYLAHYAAAKAAMPGLANSLASEGAPFNIHCNVIAPTAMSRMISTGLPSEDLSKLSIDPMDVAQLAVWLCHENTNETGSLYEVGGGFVAKLRYAHSKGAKFESGAFTAQDIEQNQQDINNFDAPFFPAGSAAMSRRTGLDFEEPTAFGE